MEDRSPQEMESLILGYEDLEGDERAVADETLRRHPELAERLAWHRRLEREAEASLPRPDETADGLTDAEVREQQTSLRRTLQRVVPGAATPVGSMPAWRRTAMWALPLAAALALVLLWPRDRSADDLLRDLQVIPVAMQGDTRGFEQVEGVLRSGQAFALEFTLEQDAQVTIFHLDPEGRFAQVHPDPETAAAVAMSAGVHRIPSTDADAHWVLSGGTGTETFFVALSTEASPRFTIADDGGALDRAERIATLLAHLREHFDEVQVHEFLHVD